MSLPNHFILSPAIPSCRIPLRLSKTVVNKAVGRFFTSSYKAFNLGDHFILESSLYFLRSAGIDASPISSWDDPSLGLPVNNVSSSGKSLIFLATANAGISSARSFLPLLELPNPPSVLPFIFGVGKKEGPSPIMDSSLMMAYKYISKTSKICLWRTSKSASFAEHLLKSRCITGINHVVSGCPVPAYFRDLAEKNMIPGLVSGEEKPVSFLITLTLRLPFVFDEISKFMVLVECLMHSYPEIRLALSLHQYLPPDINSSRVARAVSSLLDFCLTNGVDVLSPKTTKDAVRAYSSYSCHIGSRLHCHLAFLGMKKSTILWSIDSRSEEFACDLGFRLFPFHLSSSKEDLAYALATFMSFQMLEESFSRVDVYKSKLVGYVSDIALLSS